MSDWFSVLLLCTNVFQFWYWSRMQQKLVDKIMSKNYAEYVHYSNQPRTVTSSQQPKSEDDVEEEQVLQELNSYFKAPGA